MKDKKRSADEGEKFCKDKQGVTDRCSANFKGI